jgi:hypothetical protein
MALGLNVLGIYAVHKCETSPPAHIPLLLVYVLQAIYRTDYIWHILYCLHCGNV